MKQLAYQLVAPIVLIALLFSGCRKDDPLTDTTSTGTRGNTEVKAEANATTQKVNNFIKSAMTDVYL